MLSALMLTLSVTAGSLIVPGPHPVGFRVIAETDAARPYASGARPLRLFVWYPASTTAAPMRFRGYAEAEGRGVEDFARRAGELAGRALAGDEIDALLARATRARPDATPAAGRFPVVLLGGGLNGTAYLHSELAEALASHGYLAVALSSHGLRPGESLNFDLRGVETLVHDMELALVRLDREPMADLRRLALVGWSVGGVAQALLEMRNQAVAAFVSLDSGVGYDYGRGLLAQWPLGDAAPRSAPFLQIDARGPSRFTVARDGTFLAGRALAWHLTSATLGHAQATSLGALLAPPGDVAPAYAALVECTRRFLDAQLRGDAAARAWIERGPRAGGIAAHLLADPDPPAPAAPVPLWGTLEPGAFRPGYRILHFDDASRLVEPKHGPYAATGEPAARRLGVHVWYPAAGGGTPLTLGDYAVIDRLGRRATSEAEAEVTAASLRNLIEGHHRPVSPAEWQALQATPVGGTLDAVPAPGPFPLLIGILRPVSTAVTAEYLASHGYVVAFVEPASFTDAGWDHDVALRDMEVAAERMRQQPGVDPRRTGAFGFSGAGFAQLLLAMRNLHVDALADIESAVFARGFQERLASSAAWDPAALRVPFLHIYGRELAADARFPQDLAPFHAMRHAPRLHLVLEQPGLDHWDVATEGMASAAVLGMRRDNAGVQRTFETANRYLRRFFDAQLKADSEAEAWLAESPAAHGLGDVASLERYPAVEAAPDAAEIERLVQRRDDAVVLAALARARSLDSESAVLAESSLNRLGYRLLAQSRASAAAEVLTLNTALRPRSANAHDSLAEALEAAGRNAAAAAAARRVIELVDADPQRSDAAPSALRENNLKRLARLSAVRPPDAVR